MKSGKKLIAAAAVAMCAIIQSGTVSAQTSGVGSDGYTRFSWRGTDNRISFWQIDPNFQFYNSHEYGPYTGYTPIAMTAAANNKTYVLWRYVDGSIVLWRLDTFLGFEFSKTYGPYTGYTAESLSVSTNGTSGASDFRVIWRYSNGSISVWDVDQNLNYLKSYVAGPYFGYDPGYHD
jgi:hypothetical protein